MQEQPPNTTQRLLILESKVAELERKASAQEDRDIALLARVDGFIDDLRRIERVQMRAFDELKAGQSRLERNVEVLADATKNHKVAIERIDANVSAILSAVRGPQKRND